MSTAETQVLAEVVLRGVVATLHDRPLFEGVAVLMPLPFFCEDSIFDEVYPSKKEWLRTFLSELEGVVGVEFVEPEPLHSGHTLTITLQGEKKVYRLSVAYWGVSAWS